MTSAEAAPPLADATPALAIEGLGHSFGSTHALEDVAFVINRGEFAVLLGLNGAGKTTLFSLLTRLYHSRSGLIRIGDFDIREKPSKALAQIGVVFQQSTIDLDLSVSQNLRYHASLHGMSRRETEERMEVELERLEMLDRADDKVRLLSGGGRRRVEIARALMHRPQVLLLDEPTVGLDINVRQAMIDHVRGLCQREDIAVLWATHLIDEVRDGDRVIILHEGSVLAFGSVDEITRNAGATTIAGAFTKLTRIGKT
ncbi:MAG: ABC transporter ATP-binding protein [Pseudomonadales bacterium]